MTDAPPTGTGSGIPTTTASGAKRWHDLDALRGFAMLLGIALHASLSFFPWVWAVQDSTASYDGVFDEFFHAVHGFRMPLFFLLSGLFTAMLWRRRGLQNLLTHRLRRIAIPLAIGMVTIVPAVSWSVSWAIDNGVEDYIEEHADIWAAVFFGNADAVETLLDRGIDVNAANEDDERNTPLHIAAYTNEAAIAELLLERGADVTARSTTGTPLDYAIFSGAAEAAEVLVIAGAADPRPPGGTWSDVPFWAAGAAEAVDGDDVLGLESWLGSLYHLWFLWFLIWLVAAFALGAVLVDRFGSGRDTPARWTGWVMWLLIPLTLVPQLQMGNGGEYAVFGPDTSTGIVPIPHVLAYYGIFFAFGVLLYGRRNRHGGLLVESIGRWWPVLLPVTAFIVLPVALGLTLTWEDATWTQASIAQVAYAWLAIVSLMGCFHFLLARERRGVRYLSDSAYWLYLIHLPMVIVAQSLVRNWDLPAGVKFVGITVVVTAIALMTYQLFVRYTPIGTLLNGKRTRPTRESRTGSAIP